MMTLRSLSVLIFAVILSAAVAGKPSENLAKRPQPVSEARTPVETAAKRSIDARTTPSVDMPSNPVISNDPDMKMDPSENEIDAEWYQNEVDRDKDAELGFWSKVALLVAGLFVLLLTAFTYFRLSFRLNKLETALQDANRQLNKNNFKLDSLQASISSVPPIVARPLVPPPFGGTVAAREAMSGRPTDTGLSSTAPPPINSPPSRLAETAEELRNVIVSMIGDPGMRASVYDGELMQFGTIWGLEISTDGQDARLVPAASEVNRRLIAILLKDEREVIILPSSRFIKDFAMTFKEILEAGFDTKTMFDCRTDGSGVLKVHRLATAQVSGDTLRNFQKGSLSGFIG